MVDDSINGHQTAHGGATDAGTLPEGNGSVVPVDHGFDILNDPAHGLTAQRLEFIKMGTGFGRIRQILAEPLLPIVAALNAHHDHLLSPAFQETLHTPAFSVGCILVGEQIVSVEEIHHRVSFGSFAVVIRKPDMQGAVRSLGGVNAVAFDDHRLYSFGCFGKLYHEAPPNAIR